MSGGSYNYFYSQLEQMKMRPSTPLRRAFIEHLKLIATALHDIEWVDSGDYGDGDEDAAIRACLEPGCELRQLIVEAKAAGDALAKGLSAARKISRKSNHGQAAHATE